MLALFPREQEIGDMAKLCSIISHTGMPSIILFFSLRYLSYTTSLQDRVAFLLSTLINGELRCRDSSRQLSLSYISTQHIESITQVTLWIYDGVLCESKFDCLYYLSANSFKRVLCTQRFAAKFKKILFQLIVALSFSQIQKKKNFGRGGKKSLCCLVSLSNFVILAPDRFGYIIASKLGEFCYDIVSKFCNHNQ